MAQHPESSTPLIAIGTAKRTASGARGLPCGMAVAFQCNARALLCMLLGMQGGGGVRQAPCLAWCCMAQLTWRGAARRGAARRVAWRGEAWRGVAWRGVARRGEAWRGAAWRGSRDAQHLRQLRLVAKTSSTHEQRPCPGTVAVGASGSESEQHQTWARRRARGHTSREVLLQAVALLGDRERKAVLVREQARGEGRLRRTVLRLVSGLHVIQNGRRRGRLDQATTFCQG